MGTMVPTPARVLGRSQLAREEALGLPHKPYRKAGQQRRLWSCVVTTGTLPVLPIWAQKAGGATEAGHRLPAAPTNPAVLSQLGMPRGKPTVPQRRAPCPLMEKTLRGQVTAPQPPILLSSGAHLVSQPKCQERFRGSAAKVMAVPSVRTSESLARCHEWGLMIGTFLLPGKAKGK